MVKVPNLNDARPYVLLNAGMRDETFEKQLYNFGRMITVLFNTATVIEAKDASFNHSLHAAIGLCTEAAEVLDIFKKHMYGKEAPLDEAKLVDEIGDVLFYTFALCMAQNIPVSNAMASVTHKLKDRYAAVLAAREQG